MKDITRCGTLNITKVITSLQGACVAVAALIQYFLMAAFCWMLVEGIYLYLLVVKVYNIDSKMTIYHVLSWCKFLHYSHSRDYLPNRMTKGGRQPNASYGDWQDLLHPLTCKSRNFLKTTRLQDFNDFTHPPCRRPREISFTHNYP